MPLPTVEDTPEYEPEIPVPMIKRDKIPPPKPPGEPRPPWLPPWEPWPPGRYS